MNNQDQNLETTVINMPDSPEPSNTATYDFSGALHLLKGGHCVARSGWNGKNMFVFLVSGSQFQVNRAPLLGIFPEGTTINYHAHVDMRTADGTIVPWLVSQTDLLADDWQLVNVR